MIDYQEIGNNIKICRIRCNLKQAELAEMVGVTSQHISHVERCQTKPPDITGGYIDSTAR